MFPLLLTQLEVDALIAFLKALTDDRVRYETPPFDHPSLNVPDGGSGAIIDFYGVLAMDDRIEIPAVGAGGNGIGRGDAPAELPAAVAPPAPRRKRRGGRRSRDAAAPPPRRPHGLRFRRLRIAVSRSCPRAIERTTSWWPHLVARRSRG
jgi:hypothetical protein